MTTHYNPRLLLKDYAKILRDRPYEDEERGRAEYWRITHDVSQQPSPSPGPYTPSTNTDNVNMRRATILRPCESGNKSEVEDENI
jgi:hypothetical protein